jgi:single-stranded-DNA-specific exonuclease
MSLRWVAPSAADPAAVAACGPGLGLPGPVGEILVRRGFTDPEAVKAFLRPHLGQLHPPDRMLGMSLAVERIAAAIERAEPVLVYGDYDVDGVTSTVLLTRVLRSLGARVDWFIPHRIEHGYGLSLAGLREVAKRSPRLLICCDCGVGSLEEVRAARELGIDVIVADHHEPGQVLPEVVALLDPKQPGCGYPERELAAVGVAFKLCQALHARFGREQRELYPYLDLVALGTIADVAPAVGENRVFMKFGLRQLERTKNPGLRALLDLTGLGGKPLSAGAVGFVLAPRINAVGRMASAAAGAEMLLTEDPVEAARLAEVLEAENQIRREMDRRTLEEARGRLSAFDPDRDFTIVLSSREWHPGVIGIVASRLMEEFYRPVMLVAVGADGVGKGSARSIAGFHLYRALAACHEHLLDYGGHAVAAGIRVHESRLEPFREAFDGYARETLAADDLVREIRIDLDLPLLDDCSRLHSVLRHFGPFGPGNARPVLAAGDLELVGYPQVVGQDHLKMRVTRDGHALDTIGFRLASRLQEVNPTRGRFAIAFTLEEDEYRGRGELQAKLLDLRPAG